MENLFILFFVLFVLLIFLVTYCNPIIIYNKIQMKVSDLYDGTFKSLDGATINFADNQKKSKETILFLNGFMMDRINFFPLASKFRKDHYRIIILDVPGGVFGKSSKEPNLDYSLVGQAKRIKELIAELGLDKIHIVSTSMGSGIAIELNAMVPELVIDNTLIAPFGMPIYNPEPTNLMFYLAKNAHKLTLDDLFTNKNISRVIYAGSNFRMPRPIVAMFSKVFKDNKDVIIKTASSFIYDFNEIKRLVDENEKINKIVSKHGYKGTDETLPLLFRYIQKSSNQNKFQSIAPTLEKIENPILVIWGDKDHIINHKTMDMMKPYIKNGEYLILKNASHAASFLRSKEIYKEMNKTLLNK